MLCLETGEVLGEIRGSGAWVVPLAGDQSKVYLGSDAFAAVEPAGAATPRRAGDQKQTSREHHGAIHLGTGDETATFCLGLARQ